MNNFGMIIENKYDFLLSKIKLLLLKILNRTENKNEQIIFFLIFEVLLFH